MLTNQQITDGYIDHYVHTMMTLNRNILKTRLLKININILLLLIEITYMCFCQTVVQVHICFVRT